MLISLTGVVLATVENAVAESTWTYEDDFETDQAVYDNWDSCGFCESCLDIHLGPCLCYWVPWYGELEQALCFCEGWMAEAAQPFLTYAALPSNGLCTGGSVEFDFAGSGTMVVYAHNAGDVATLGTVTVGPYEVQSFSLPVQYGDPMQFVKFYLSDGEPGDLYFYPCPAIDDLRIEVQYVLLGDLTCDGLINGFDIDPFVLVLGNYLYEYYDLYPACDHMLADLNQDGLVNGFDIDPFVVLIGGGWRDGPVPTPADGNSLSEVRRGPLRISRGPGPDAQQDRQPEGG
jgi:hypothetical protein